MDEVTLNTSVRKFLKKVGVTAQREIELAVRTAALAGTLPDGQVMPAKAMFTIGGINLSFEIEGELDAG